MQRLDQRILLAATVFFAALATFNRDLVTAILAVACLAAWTVITVWQKPR